MRSTGEPCEAERRLGRGAGFVLEPRADNQRLIRTQTIELGRKGARGHRLRPRKLRRQTLDLAAGREKAIFKPAFIDVDENRLWRQAAGLKHGAPARAFRCKRQGRAA